MVTMSACVTFPNYIISNPACQLYLLAGLLKKTKIVRGWLSCS